MHMTIRDVTRLTGLSHQAVYKKIKTAGLNMDELKDKATGQLTPDGEQKVRDLFGIAEDTGTPQEKPLQPDATELRNQVAELTTEVEKLRNHLATAEDQIKALTEERDFLRVTLERSQHLEAAAIAKLPSPAALLTDGSGDQEQRRGLRGWFARRRNRHAD